MCGRAGYGALNERAHNGYFIDGTIVNHTIIKEDGTVHTCAGLQLTDNEGIILRKECTQFFQIVDRSVVNLWTKKDPLSGIVCTGERSLMERTTIGKDFTEHLYTANGFLQGIAGGTTFRKAESQNADGY